MCIGNVPILDAVRDDLFTFSALIAGLKFRDDWFYVSEGSGGLLTVTISQLKALLLHWH